MDKQLTKQHRALNQLVNIIDRLTQFTGHSVAWLLLVMVLVQSFVVILRYGFEIGSIALQETVTYLHACCFMLGAAFTLKMDAHVRVDILYQRFNPRQQAIVNLLGSILLLMPVCLFIFWTSIDYVQQSWSLKERSADSGGLAIVYLLKSLIPLLALTLIAQGIAEVARCSLRLLPNSASSHQH